MLWAAKAGLAPQSTAIGYSDCRRVGVRISGRMGTSESYGRNFNRREVKWALRSDSVEVAQYMTGLPPVDMIKLTSRMFEELRLSDLPSFLLACREAVNLVEDHDNDKREMIDEIILVIERFGEAKVIDSKKKTNFAIATYMSLARVTEMASFLSGSVEFPGAEGSSG